LWVVLFHASEGGHLAALKAQLPAIAVHSIFDLGHLGVAVFFVLSGFVMAYTVRGGPVDATFAARFVLRRLIRLTPPYWFSIAVVLLLLAIKARALQSGATLPGPAVVLANAAYVEDILGLPLLNYVYWTLGIEVQFYVAFALLVVAADRIRTPWDPGVPRILLFALTGAVALAWPCGVVSGPVWRGDFLPFWFTFAEGALVCWGWLAGSWMALLSLAMCAAVGLAGWVGDSAYAYTAAATGLALLAAGRLHAMHRWLDWRPLQFLGLISYSLYLLHNPLTGAGFNLVRRVLPAAAASEVAGLATTLAICVTASYAAFRFVESPSQRWSHAIRLKRASQPRDSAPESRSADRGHPC
jgi:peptidoglycan/LPS O-acetylase OafA/YrhL